MRKLKHPDWKIPAGISAATFLAFLPALRGGLLDFGDKAALSDRAAWLTYQREGVYQPLVWLSFALDRRLWGSRPEGFHLQSLLIHSLNAALAYAVILKLLERRGTKVVRSLGNATAAAIGALFFAVHPLRVETVAWVAARPYLLCCFFLLLSILAFFKAEEDPKRSGAWSLAAIAAYASSLLCSWISICLPIFLFLERPRMPREIRHQPIVSNDEQISAVWLEKIPYALLAYTAAVVAANGRYLYGAPLTLPKSTWPLFFLRPLNAAGFFIFRSVLPLELHPIYPAPLDTRGLLGGAVIGAATLVFGTFAAYYVRRQSWRPLALWIGGLALFLPAAFWGGDGRTAQRLRAADSWTYLPSIVAAASASVLLARLLAKWGAKKNGARSIVSVSAIIFVLFLGLSWHQIGFWKDDGKILMADVAAEPDCIDCKRLLGEDASGLVSAYVERANWGPSDAEPLFSEGMRDVAQSKLDEAIPFFEAALRADPASFLAENTEFNLGFLYSRKDMNRAIAHTQAALRINPNNASAHNNLGFFLQAQGRIDEAIVEYAAALRLNPGMDLARNNLAALKAQRARH